MDQEVGGSSPPSCTNEIRHLSKSGRTGKGPGPAPGQHQTRKLSAIGGEARSEPGRGQSASITPDLDEQFDYESIKALADGERRADTLIALADKNDPFYIRPGRRRKAEWFAALWREHWQPRLDSRGRPSQMHIRGIHYVLVSLPIRPLREGRDDAYENTDQCFKEMDEASRDARLLDLVPIDRISDERNDAPIEYLPNYAEYDRPDAELSSTDPDPLEIDVEPLETLDGPPPSLFVEEQPLKQLKVLGLSKAPPQIELPESIEAPELPESKVDLSHLDLIPPPSVKAPELTPPLFHIEIFCEKTTMNDILLDIARRRRLNLITGPGFQSLTGAWRLVQRAKRSGRPVRVFYISDFDPKGREMPVAVARVVEYLIRREGLNLDIKLIPVALTEAQCSEFNLPRTPLKETMPGKDAWEERFGHGATELDALEALHPGALREILLREIDRYSDPSFLDRVEEVHGQLQDEVDGIHSAVAGPYTEELEGLVTAPQEIIDRRNAETESFLRQRLDELNARIAEIATSQVESMNARLASVRDEVEAINREIERLYAPRIVMLNVVLDEVRGEAEALDIEVRRIAEEGIDEINACIRDIDGRHTAEIDEVRERIGEIQAAIRSETERAAQPAIDAVAWPQPQEAASATPPLFDSSRSYLDQIEHYRRFQGKEVAPILKRGYRFKLTCEICANSFERQRRASTCSAACRQAKYRQLVAACRNGNA